jgi:hypothetical protein
MIGPPFGNSEDCANKVVTSPANPTVTPTESQASRPSPVARAEAKSMCATSAAQVQPTARQAGAAAPPRLPPPTTATNAATPAVTAHATTSRRTTLTDGRAVRRGDIDADFLSSPAGQQPQT